MNKSDEDEEERGEKVDGRAGEEEIDPEMGEEGDDVERAERKKKKQEGEGEKEEKANGGGGRWAYPVGLYNLLAAEVVVLGADEGFSHWQSDLQETVRPADVGWHWHRYWSLSSGLNWNDSGTNSADGETSLVGSVVSTVALVELQEEEEQPVRRQMLVVLMLEVMERGKKKEVVARNMQEVGDADADGQS
ncbi:unnamed protein product [Fusarium venenatum]|uniref:Uncharacterized protein n=1 Tax=Fusarium venenatum TaxID=56646 RepID=A0A2L2TDS7_9HYPO|nr:LOW QUALITY PROTEIN: uncharacterized protein FVRRES_05592 [Fusarium venenatum]CEI61156.1 unnamed protein product [Fusarium venenatum]